MDLNQVAATHIEANKKCSSSITDEVQQTILLKKQRQEVLNSENLKQILEKAQNENFASQMTKQLFEAAFLKGQNISEKAYLANLNSKL